MYTIESQRAEFNNEVETLLKNWDYEGIFALARRTVEHDEPLAQELFAKGRKLKFDVESAYDESINN